MLWACETELMAKLIHLARQTRWGLNITLAEGERVKLAKGFRRRRAEAEQANLPRQSHNMFSVLSRL